MSQDLPEFEREFSLEKYVDNIHELLARFPDIDELYVQSILLAKVFKRVLKARANFKLSSDPKMERVPIVEFCGRMRVWSLEKFKNTTYISSINFYKTEEDRQANKALGAIVLYIGEEYVAYLLQRLGYPEVSDEPEELESACGTLLNLIAANFKNGLTQLGYKEPIMSHFLSCRAEVPGGIAYDNSCEEKYELSMELAGSRVVMLDLTMGDVEKKINPYI